jgi:hypothetical protein
LKVSPTTLKLVHEIIDKTLQDTGIGGDFLNRTPIAQVMIASTDKRYRIRLKSFCTAKETINRVKRAYRMRENLCRLFFRHY